MIDTHCHLETMQNCDEVIARCKAGLKAVITVATHPRDFAKGLDISERYKRFVFLSAGVHPEFIKELSEQNIESAFQWLEKYQDKLVGIGEQGLDYFWVKEQAWQEKQKELFAKSIQLAKELDKVIVVHAREADGDVIEILEKQHAERVQLHMWGAASLAEHIIDNGWYVSVGPIVARSKKHKAVVQRMPVEQLMLETDSPWFGGTKSIAGEPTNIRIPSEEIAKIKEMNAPEVWELCAKNAIKLFRLKV